MKKHNKNIIKTNRVLSGMRPTGPLHIGHLVGALKNWIDLQNEFECLFMVADWHGFMSEYEDPVNLGRNSLTCAAEWIACGVDPEKCAIFIQSHVQGHLELSMIFSCLTSLAWLERNPTYKEQLREMKTRDLTTYGFLGYPILQAADILVYRADRVPIGLDQLPHLELTREIVRRFNKLYGSLLPEPVPILTKTPKLLGTDNRKMSKSYDNFIALADSEEIIRKKTAAMITDPKRIYRKDPGHPEKCNVRDYYRVFAPDENEKVSQDCKSALIGCADCKKRLAEILNSVVAPIREKRDLLLKDTGRLKKILSEGAEKAGCLANENMKTIKNKLGFYELQS